MNSELKTTRLISALRIVSIWGITVSTVLLIGLLADNITPPIFISFIVTVLMGAIIFIQDKQLKEIYKTQAELDEIFKNIKDID